MVRKIAIVNDSDDDDETHQGLFINLSNAIKQLDHLELDKDHQFLDWKLAFFISKTLIYQGLCPPLDTCILSGHSLQSNFGVKLHVDRGGFALTSDLSTNQNSDRPILNFLLVAAQTKYADVIEMQKINKNVALTLFEFLCFQYNLSRLDFRTSEVLYS